MHPLLMHAAVVLTPLTALALGISAVWPAARRRIGLALPIAALVVAVLVPVTVLAGQSLADIVGRTPAVQRHEALGLMLLPWAIAMLPVSVVVWASDRLTRRAHRAQEIGVSDPDAPARRARIVTLTITVLGVVCAAGALTFVILTGDAGARAVWGGLL